MKIRICISVILTAALLSGCDDKPDCLKGTGPQTSEERPAGQVNRIELLCNADVIIHPSGENRIKVTCGANLIDKIETDLNDGNLVIRNRNRCNWVRSFNPSISVEVWTDDLVAIRTDDSNGDVTFSDTLHVYEFRFDSYSSLGVYHVKLNAFLATLALHNGPADFFGEGKITVSYVYNSGYGIMDFRNIESEIIFMNNRGTNDTYVNVSELLDAKLEGSGNIYYKGNPPIVQTTITGTGVILPLQ